ncbi:MAG TPA: helix-turn-helix domain-containing protein, partial [Polyangia bacterium]|nr:helix-turn-helix domain-containing protein [Polyangia bacterium]
MTDAPANPPEEKTAGDENAPAGQTTYTFAAAAKILGVSESKLRYWAQVGFVGPSARRAGKPVYSFQDLVGVKAAKELTERGFKTSEIRKAIDGV